MLWLVALGVFWALLFWDRIDLWRKARKLPGPTFSIPFVGQTVQMVMQPFKFYERQEKLGPMSWNSAGGKYDIVCVHDCSIIYTEITGLLCFLKQQASPEMFLIMPRGLFVCGSFLVQKKFLARYCTCVRFLTKFQ